jgi:3-oxoacid CoA-transferase
LINEIRANKSRINGLTAVSNNAGTNGSGLSLLLETRQIKKRVASYIGDNKIFRSQYGNGELEVELTTQGTITKKCRAGGAGIPAFHTPAAMGTVVQTGELPTKHHPDGTPADFHYQKMTKSSMESLIFLKRQSMEIMHSSRRLKQTDWAIASSIYLRPNFKNPMSRNAKMTIVEAEHIVEVGELEPSNIHLPRIYVKRVIQSQVPKAIEKYVNSKESDVSTNSASPASSSSENSNREKIALRAAREFKNGMYVNLGIGIPVLASTFVPPEVEVLLHSENGILGLGPYPKKGEENPDLINVSKETTTIIPGACTFSSDESFGMIRSGRIDLTILGAMQVNATGDLANCKYHAKFN